MATRDSDLYLRPGRIRQDNKGRRQFKSFVGQVMRAAKKAGHSGSRFGGTKGGKGGSTFGRGRKLALATGMQSSARRVTIKAKVARHKGLKFRSAPLARHITYLKRDGVTRDGQDARLFDAQSNEADGAGFAQRCEDDRHHFRFIVSPEDAARLADLKLFTRRLMAQGEDDLETRLDWVAVEHWNTDNPHIHVLVRGVADDGKDLVISRDYISRGLRTRAAEQVALELGPRSEQEIQSALASEVTADRWTALDQALQRASDSNGGVTDLRPEAVIDDRDLRVHLVGRAAKLERLGLAELVGPCQWTLKPGLEHTLRELAIRGDIIKTMHQAMRASQSEPDTARFAIHAAGPAEPVIGRLVQRGLQDELSGAAYAIIEAVDGRTHHLRFTDIDQTSDALPGAIVESRAFQDAGGRPRLILAVRSDLTLEQQVTAQGATWIDRKLLAPDPPLASAGFGAEVQAAMNQRADYLERSGFARRQGTRLVFTRDLLATLRRQELESASAELSSSYGLVRQPVIDGAPVSGIYRQRVTLASGRFAMIDDGLGFQLVPWRPALEQYLGQEVRGRAKASGIEWFLGRNRGLTL